MDSPGLLFPFLCLPWISGFGAWYSILFIWAWAIIVDRWFLQGADLFILHSVDHTFRNRLKGEDLLFDDKLPVWFDPEQIKQVLINLIKDTRFFRFKRRHQSENSDSWLVPVTVLICCCHVDHRGHVGISFFCLQMEIELFPWHQERGLFWLLPQTCQGKVVQREFWL